MLSGSAAAPAQLELIVVFWSVQQDALSDVVWGASRCPLFGQDPALSPSLMQSRWALGVIRKGPWISCQGGKPKRLFFGRKYLRSESTTDGCYSFICSASSYSGPNAQACTPGEQWFTGWMGPKWKDSAALRVSCRTVNREERNYLHSGFAVLFEALNISRLVLSLVRWHYLDMHWSRTVRLKVVIE